MGVYSVILHGGYVLEIGIIMIIIAEETSKLFLRRTSSSIPWPK